MKVVLIQPKTPSLYKPREPPLSLAILAAVLENAGYEVRCLDMEISKEKDLFDLFTEFKPVICGLSATTSGILSAEKLAKKIKNIDPNVRIIIGGFGVTCDPEFVMSKENFDYGVLGEAEITLIELCDALKNNDLINNVKGVAWRTDGKVIISEPRPLIADLDQLPFPAFYHFDIKKYGKSLPIFTSRGCPFRCIYCVAHKVVGRVFRSKSPKKVVDEMEYMKKRYKINMFSIVDDNFALDKKRAIEICDEIIKRRLNVNWMCGQGIRLTQSTKNY